MKIDAEDFRRHYASLPDEALLEIDAAELTQVARQCYHEEISRRGLDQAAGDSDEEMIAEEEDHDYATSDFDSGEKPNWLEHAECAFSFSAMPGEHNTPELDEARHVLESARIPCYVAVPRDPETGKPAPAYELMVPSALYLEAIGLLDKEIFNPEIESTWRIHLAALSDDELRAIKPKSLVVGLLDRAERLTKVYKEEMEERRLRRDASEDDGAAGARR